MQMPFTNWPKVFVGINTYSGKNGERIKYLNTFLKSISINTTYTNYKIFIYDDCSPINIDKLKYDNLNITYIRGSTPLVRWHLVRNELFKLAIAGSYDYYMLFDDDFEVIQKNWIKHIINCMENIPEIGILGGFWATREDGTTRQQQHTPIGYLIGNNFEVSINKFVCGGSWTIRPEVVKQIGMFPVDVKYDAGNPGADTYYHNLMLQKTPYKLCCTRTDMAKHTGQEFMRDKFKDKYNTPEFQSGERLY